MVLFWLSYTTFLFYLFLEARAEIQFSSLHIYNCDHNTRQILFFDFKMSRLQSIGIWISVIASEN